MVKNMTKKRLKKGRYTPPKTLKKPMKIKGLDDDTTRIARHVNMIVDPCNAELGPTAYRGSDGFVNRFRNVLNTTPTAGKSGFIYVYYPAYNAVFYVNVTPTDTPVFSASNSGPGQSFLLSNGASQRVVGACCSLTYTGTELDRQGVIYSGVIPIAALSTANTVNDIAANLQHEHRVSDDLLEVKWTPGAVEEEYWQSGAASPEGSGDRNAIVIIALGLNNASTSMFMSITNTLVCEWKPDPGFGLGSTNPSSHDVPGGLEKVRSTLQKMGNWWYSVGKAAHSAYNSTTGKALRGLILAAMA